MTGYRRVLLARRGDCEGELAHEHEDHDRTLCRGSDCDDTTAPPGDDEDDNDCDGAP